MMMWIDWWHIQVVALSLIVCGAGISGAGAVTRMAIVSPSHDQSPRRQGACTFGASLMLVGIALGAIEVIIRYWHP